MAFDQLHRYLFNEGNVRGEFGATFRRDLNAGIPQLLSLSTS